MSVPSLIKIIQKARFFLDDVLLRPKELDEIVMVVDQLLEILGKPSGNLNFEIVNYRTRTTASYFGYRCE